MYYRNDGTSFVAGVKNFKQLFPVGTRNYHVGEYLVSIVGNECCITATGRRYPYLKKGSSYYERFRKIRLDALDAIEIAMKFEHPYRNQVTGEIDKERHYLDYI